MTDSNKEIVSRFGLEGFGKGDESVLDELVAIDYVDHGAPPGVEPGLEGTKAFVRQLHAAFTDIELSQDDMVAEGDKVAVRWTWTATHTGEFMGVPASGQRVTVAGFEIDRVADGQIKEAWSLVDFASFLIQTGVLPMPGG